jgi:hypothetical protein
LPKGKNPARSAGFLDVCLPRKIERGCVRAF